eukprot:Skav208595  [mRNA]  locus=scaffold3715:119990:124616:+ [translate_table: standard]
MESFGDWGFDQPADWAFFLGKKVDVKCIQNNDEGIVVCSYTKGVPEFRAKCDNPKWFGPYVTVGQTMTLLDFKWGHAMNGSELIVGKDSPLLPIVHAALDNHEIAEGFAGVGGWSWAASKCARRPCLHVEHDPVIAETCARAHDLPLLTIQSAMSLLQSHNMPDACVLLADMVMKETWIIAGCLNVGTWLISPPCQPWSKAGQEKGLSCQEGALFPRTIIRASIAKVFSLNVENVKGIQSHQHFGALKRIFHLAGYQLYCAKIDKVYPLLPVQRDRWMATLISSDIQVFESRVFQTNQALPTMMAMYGNQHRISHNLLAEKGLFTFLVDDGHAQRLMTPFVESAMSLGMPVTLVLPADYTTAWKVVGNTLTIAQAMMQCTRAHIMLGDASPFRCDEFGVEDICHTIVNSRVNLELFRVVVEGNWMTLVPVTVDMYVVPSLEIDDDVNDDPIESFHGSPAHKKACISPTWHFSVADPIEPQATLVQSDQCDELPLQTFQIEEGKITVEQCRRQCQEQHGCVNVQIHHDQGFWAVVFNLKNPKSVKHVLSLVLPHAKPEHFDEIMLNNIRVVFSSCPTNLKSWHLTFKTKKVQCVVYGNLFPKETAVNVDVIWTFQDLVAFVAADLAILPQQIRISHDDQTMQWDHFVLAEAVNRFKMEIQPLALTFDEQHAEQSVDQVEITPAPKIRITFVQPGWNSIRTAAFDETINVADAIAVMLPNTCDQNRPRFYVNSQVVDDQCELRDLLNSKLCIRFTDRSNPWIEVTEVPVSVIQADKRHVDKYEGRPNQQFWVKGPFDARDKQCRLPIMMPIYETAADYIPFVHVPTTLMILQQGQGIEAGFCMEEVNPYCTMEIRVCPLIGGAKNNDGACKKLRTILASKGVDEAALDARVAMITAKIPISEINTLLSHDEASAWTALKKRANEMKLRMITNQELKEFQKTQRLKAASSNTLNDPKPKKGAKPMKRKVDEGPKQVTIDPVHFKGGDKPMKLIDVSQWGPDKSGLLITTVEQAQKLLPVRNITPDPMAMLVLTNEPFQGTSPIAIPAVTMQGHPVLASVCIVNYGDAPVTFTPQIPKRTLKVVETSIIEVTIRRQMVLQWTEAQSVSNYMGLHLPEIRNSKVISQWSFSAYDEKRNKCAHADAVYIHGYIKIAEELLDSTLARSGLAGIFLQVRTQDKRPDQRFGVIPMFGATLEEVLKMAKNIPNVLGIVQTGKDQVFSLRARKEHLADIKKVALPESIRQQQGDIPPGATYWYLKHVRQSTGCKELTEALVGLGWEASAVKPIGMSTWLVCSKTDPPASHICLGDDYVAVHPMKSHANKSQNLNPVLKMAAVSVVPHEEVSDDASTASRLSDLRTDLEERLTHLVNQKMSQCDEKIGALAGTVSEVQSQMTNVTTVTEQTRNDLLTMNEQHKALQQQIDNNNQGLITQMKSLFDTMQSELKSELAKNDGAKSPKRSKTH